MSGGILLHRLFEPKPGYLSTRSSVNLANKTNQLQRCTSIRTRLGNWKPHRAERGSGTQNSEPTNRVSQLGNGAANKHKSRANVTCSITGAKFYCDARLDADRPGSPPSRLAILSSRFQPEVTSCNLPDATSRPPVMTWGKFSPIWIPSHDKMPNTVAQSWPAVLFKSGWFPFVLEIIE